MKKTVKVNHDDALGLLLRQDVVNELTLKFVKSRYIYDTCVKEFGVFAEEMLKKYKCEGMSIVNIDPIKNEVEVEKNEENKD